MLTGEIVDTTEDRLEVEGILASCAVPFYKSFEAHFKNTIETDFK